MPKTRFNPKSFDSYVKQNQDYPDIDQVQSGLDTENPRLAEDNFSSSPTDARDDYWNDVHNAKAEVSQTPRQQRPLKQPKRMIRQFNKRGVRRNNGR